MVKLLVATRNPGKMREIALLLENIPVAPVSLEDEGIGEEAEETEPTFRGNAILKSRFFSRRSPLLVVAEDSGLEVDALGGEPGVYSARYGGPGLDGRQRYRLVLEKMAGVEEESRRARFVCWLALCRGGTLWGTFSGVCSGMILNRPQGEGGFGYDPIFSLPGRGITTSQIPAHEKNLISHRGRAFRLLNAWLKKHPPEP